jgi:hypothetical protein
MFIITMELLYHGIMGAIFPKLPEKEAYRIDNFAFLFFCFLILAKQAALIYWIYKVKKNRQKSYHLISFDENNNSNNTSNSNEQNKIM